MRAWVMQPARCACGRQIIGLAVPRCEVCRIPACATEANRADRVMAWREEGLRMAAIYDQPGQTLGTVARRFNVSRETVATRLRLVERERA